MSWITDLDSMIFTRIKYKLEKKFKTKYPDFNVTNTDKSLKEPKFPNVYIQVLGNPEAGETTEAEEINAVVYTMQIDVTTKTQLSTREVSDEVINILKEMMFKGVAFPYPSNTDDTFRNIARFRRTIAVGDTI